MAKSRIWVVSIFRRNGGDSFHSLDFNLIVHIFWIKRNYKRIGLLNPLNQPAKHLDREIDPLHLVEIDGILNPESRSNGFTNPMLF